MSSIGDKLRQLRDEHNWTLTYVAKRTGVSVSHLSALENGTRKHPSFHIVATLAALYGIPLTALAPDDVHVLPDSAPPVLVRDAPSRFNLKDNYDAATYAFLLSEVAAPYVAFAMKLSQAEATLDTSTLLEWIAQFMRNPSTPYEPPRKRKYTSRQPDL